MKEGRKWYAICRTGNEVLVFVGRKLIIERCLLCVCIGDGDGMRVAVPLMV